MPSEKILQEKQAYVEGLAEKLKSAVAGVVVSYQGLNVADDTQLRRELRAAGVEYAVVKNTLLRRACDIAGLPGWTRCSTALPPWPSAPIMWRPPKILDTFAEKNKAVQIKAGFVEGKVIAADEVKELAKMPPKEVLVAKALGGLNAPISGFVCVLNANLRGLAVALNAIAEQKNA